MVVEIFKDPALLQSNKYDSFASLSNQLKYNNDASRMITEAAQQFRLSRAPALRMAITGTDWDNYMNIVPYSV